MANIQYTEEFAFYQQLKFYYDSNRGKIRSRYNDLTKKFLAYNDKSENPDAFLRLPQFEALEMYVFIKEFMGKLEDGSYQLIEVKGDNKIDDTVVKAKAAAAQEMAVASGIEYKMYAGSEIMTTHILAYLDGMASTISYADHMQQGTLSMVAETSAPYGSDK